MKNDTQKHTPTPWRTHITSNKDHIEIGYWDGDCSGSVCEFRPGEESAANAAFIVRAVNSHEAMLEKIYEIQNHAQGKCNHSDVEECNTEILRLSNQAIAQAKVK